MPFTLDFFVFNADTKKVQSESASVENVKTCEEPLVPSCYHGTSGRFIPGQEEGARVLQGMPGLAFG